MWREGGFMREGFPIAAIVCGTMLLTALLMWLSGCGVPDMEKGDGVGHQPVSKIETWQQVNHPPQDLGLPMQHLRIETEKVEPVTKWEVEM